MPYNHQGIATAEGCKKIDINYLFKHGYIKKHNTTIGSLKWTVDYSGKSDSIGFKTVFSDIDKYLELNYIYDYTGEKREKNYRIYFDCVKSNLGKGLVYYFLCPETELRCRVLYMAYGSDIFKSRFAYRHRIYYNIQTVSKYMYSTQRYFKLDKIVKNLEKTRMKTHYKGRGTRTYKRYLNLRSKLGYFDSMRALSLCNSLCRLKGFRNMLEKYK